MKINTKIGLLFTITLLLATACRKEVEYPIEPLIEYKSFYVFPQDNGKDKAVFTISFTDGDGDVGLKESDTLDPYIGDYHYNFFIDIFFKEKGAFKKFIFLDTTLNYNARIPYIPIIENSKGIRGDIDIALEWIDFKEAFDRDTIYFEIYILDRAFHKSNKVSSPQLIVN